MPSGVLYTRGLLASYLTAAVAAFGGLSYTTGRLLSVCFGLATIGSIWWVGRRGWNGRVGWLAALGLALLPEAIIWSSRARFYAQLQFLVLLMLVGCLCCHAAQGPKLTINNQQLTIDNSELLIVNSQLSIVNDKPSPRLYALFAALFTLALFSQEQTILLYPPILLATLLWRGWRYLRQPPVLIAHLVCLGAMAVRYAIEIVGQPGFFETIQAERPYVGLIFDLPTAWAAYAELFIAPARLPWTLGALLAVGAALVALARRRWRLLESGRISPGDALFRLAVYFCPRFHPDAGGRPVARCPLSVFRPALSAVDRRGWRRLAGGPFPASCGAYGRHRGVGSALRPAALAASSGRAHPPGGGLRPCARLRRRPAPARRCHHVAPTARLRPGAWPLRLLCRPGHV